MRYKKEREYVHDSRYTSQTISDEHMDFIRANLDKTPGFLIKETGLSRGIIAGNMAFYGLKCTGHIKPEKAKKECNGMFDVDEYAKSLIY